MSDEWKLYKHFTSRTTAQIAQAMLKQNGINAVLMDKKDSLYGHGFIELYVPVNEYLTALAIDIPPHE